MGRLEKRGAYVFLALLELRDENVGHLAISRGTPLLDLLADHHAEVSQPSTSLVSTLVLAHLTFLLEPKTKEGKR